MINLTIEIFILILHKSLYHINVDYYNINKLLYFKLSHKFFNN